MTTKTFFDKLPTALAKNPKLGAGIDATFHLKVRGAGEWTLSCKGAPALTAGLAGKPDCTVECDQADFASVLRDSSAAMRLYVSGKIQVRGNALLVAKLAPILGAVK